MNGSNSNHAFNGGGGHATRSASQSVPGTATGPATSTGHNLPMDPGADGDGTQGEAIPSFEGTFPSPPAYFTRYTEHNLGLLRVLRERTHDAVAGDEAGTSGGLINGVATGDAVKGSHDEPIDIETQRQVLNDQEDVPFAWALTDLEKPRADWIIEDGGYQTFGDHWPIPERQLTLEEGGIVQLYPNDPSRDHRPALQKLLQTLLQTYHSMLTALLKPPRAIQQTEPEWHRKAEWIRLVAINMISAVNELRPMQARETLELTLRTQLDNRRQETARIHSKCDALSERLALLRTAAGMASTTTTSIKRKGGGGTDDRTWSTSRNEAGSIGLMNPALTETATRLSFSSAGPEAMDVDPSVDVNMEDGQRVSKFRWAEEVS